MAVRNNDSDQAPKVSKGDIIIREATPSDIDMMTSLDEICFTVPWRREDFEKELTGNHLALYIVAEDNGQVVGYAGLWCIVDEGHITNVAVHPDYRKEGLGWKLVNTMLINASEKFGTKNFTLEVRVSNMPAIKLYRSFGFAEVGRRRKYYSDNKEDAAIMWLMNEEMQEKN